METKSRKRGFGSMDKAQQSAIASKGGKAAHKMGKAHQFTSAEAREAGRLGGMKISQDLRHMSEIGKLGGAKVSADKAHMSEIGRKGGAAVSADREHMAEIGAVGGHKVSADTEHMQEIGRKGGITRQAASKTGTDE